MRRKRESIETSIRFEIFLLIAGIIVIIGTLAPWVSVQGEVIMSSGLNTWNGPLAFAGGFIAIFGATVNFRAYRIGTLQKYRPYTDGGLGIIGSALALIGAFAFLLTMEAAHSPAWGLYLTIISGIFGVISAVGVFKESSPKIPKGLSSKGVSA